MVRRVTTILSCSFWLGFVPAAAQSAEDYFHSGAGHYIHGQVSEASTAVEAGLAIAPAHPKLLALKEKIDEEEERSGDSDQQNDEQQQQDEQQPSDQQQQEQQQEEQQQEQGDEEQESSEDEQEASGGDDHKTGTDPSEAEQQPEPQQADPGNPEELSPEQARQILDALARDEEELLRQVQKMKARPQRVEKDW